MISILKEVRTKAKNIEKEIVNKSCFNICISLIIQWDILESENPLKLCNSKYGHIITLC